MTSIQLLATEALCTQCNPAQFSFATTAELEDLTQVLGQTRAVEALKFGIGIRRDGYNLFVFGEPGTGKRTVVRQFLDERPTRETRLTLASTYAAGN